MRDDPLLMAIARARPQGGFPDAHRYRGPHTEAWVIKQRQRRAREKAERLAAGTPSRADRADPHIGLWFWGAT